MRAYVAVTSFEPLRIYLYQEGLVRFATSPYRLTLDSLDCAFTHLTNYSINKTSPAYSPNTLSTVGSSLGGLEL